MSEVIQAPEREAEDASGPKRISHWIGGRIVAGESGRSGPVYNPATGEQTGAVDFASARGGGRRRPRRPRGISRVALPLARPGGPTSSSASASSSRRTARTSRAS